MGEAAAVADQVCGVRLLMLRVLCGGRYARLRFAAWIVTFRIRSWTENDHSISRAQDHGDSGDVDMELEDEAAQQYDAAQQAYYSQLDPQQQQMYEQMAYQNYYAMYAQQQQPQQQQQPPQMQV